jgi:deoxycytidylate deaminase
MNNLRLNNLWYEEALNQAKKSSVTHKCGAILVYRNKIVSKGYNYHRCDRISTNTKSCLLCSK